jgi:hypothetical protein
VLGEVIVTVVVVVVAAAIVMLEDAEAVCPFASVTAKVKVLVPVLTGVPANTPELLRPRAVLQEPEQPVMTQL